MKKVVVSNKFKLKDLYDEYKKNTGKKIVSCEQKELDPFCSKCWIDLVVGLSIEMGKHITLSKGMMLLAE